MCTYISQYVILACTQLQKFDKIHRQRQQPAEAESTESNKEQVGVLSWHLLLLIDFFPSYAVG